MSRQENVAFCICVAFVVPEASAVGSVDNQEESSDMITITGLCALCCIEYDNRVDTTCTRSYLHYGSQFSMPLILCHLFSEFCVAMAAGKLKSSVKEPNIFLFSTHHSIMFCFRCSVYWWKGSVRF